jgi:hypothetical protein
MGTYLQVRTRSLSSTQPARTLRLMSNLTVVESEPHRSGAPSWIEPSLNVTPGRDPLGLQTITLDRIMPRLLPGILVLSQRARYFSLHAFLLSEYQRLRLPLTNNDLSVFVKLREFEYAVAVQLLSPRLR